MGVIEIQESVFGEYSKDDWDRYRIRIYGDLARKKKQIFERDGNRCVVCYMNRDLQAHHITSVAECMKKGDSIAQINGDENIITLCQWCHHLIENEPPVETLWYNRYIIARKIVLEQALSQLDEVIQPRQTRPELKEAEVKYKEHLLKMQKEGFSEDYEAVGIELGTNRVLIREKEKPEDIEDDLVNKDNHDKGIEDELQRH